MLLFVQITTTEKAGATGIEPMILRSVAPREVRLHNDAILDFLKTRPQDSVGNYITESPVESSL